MARVWAQNWDNNRTSYHRNKDDIIDFARFYNARFPNAQKTGNPYMVSMEPKNYETLCDSPRGLWGR